MDQTEHRLGLSKFGWRPADGVDDGSVAKFGVAQEFGGLSLPSGEKPLSQRGMEEHQRAVTSSYKKISDDPIAILELVPSHFLFDVEG